MQLTVSPYDTVLRFLAGPLSPRARIFSPGPKPALSGFGGLGVSMLAFGTRVRGFETGRNRRIFQGEKNSACLPSEGK
jgi:hypothetical protein